MATKPNSKSRNSSTVALSPTLKTVPATEGVEQLRTLQRAYGLIPAAAVAGIEESLTELEDLLSDNAFTTYELVMDQARVLSMLTGVPRNEITRVHPTQVAERLHAGRNLVVSVAALGARTIGVPSAATRAETVFAHSVKLFRRSTKIRRPLAHDEILLCRVATHLACFEDPGDHTATIYTLLDAGLVPGETSHARIDDLDDPEMPQLLLAAGNGHLAPRYISLDQFVAHTLGRRAEHDLRRGKHPETRLTYNPRVRSNGQQHQPGSNAATASAQRTIDRFLDHLRLPTGDITASSIPHWRIATTLTTHGETVALTLSGRSSREAMLHNLGLPAAKPTPSTRYGSSFDTAA